MAEAEQENKGEDKAFSRIDFSSKFWKTFLVLLAVFLTFGGPTYMVYVVFLKILKLSYLVSMLSGFILFIAGLVLLWYLIRKKVVA